jgi:signal transduction histidine kinase
LLVICGVIAVEDDGPGIDPLLLDTQSVSGSTKSSGSGLGLFLCRRTVSASGGRFSIRNRANGGCVVRLELPVDDGVPPDSTDSPPESGQVVAV